MVNRSAQLHIKPFKLIILGTLNRSSFLSNLELVIFLLEINNLNRYTDAYSIAFSIKRVSVGLGLEMGLEN